MPRHRLKLSTVQRILMLVILTICFLVPGSMVVAADPAVTPAPTPTPPNPGTAAGSQDSATSQSGTAAQGDTTGTGTQEGGDAATSPSPTPEPKLPSLAKVRVLKVEKLENVQRQATQDAGTPQTASPVKNAARLQEIILVTVSDLRNLVRTSKCLSDKDQPVVPCAPQAIGLFLDGRHIKGIVPESGAPTLVESPGAPEPVDGRLQFHLQRNANSDEAWADLLGAPPLGKSFFERPTEVSVGLENGYALPTDVKANAPDKQRQFWLIRIDQIWFIICSILLLFVLVVLILLAKHSELLRDLGPTQVFENWPGLSVWWRERHQREHKPYSLARFQMAFWFFLVVASFLFIWLITGANDTITGSTLALIGIGAGTALGSAAIDAAGDGNAPAQPQVSRGFLTDILTDHTSGISFHRFQMFMWTLVLGVLFIYSVWSRLSMPEFSATLLAMLGISSGTYLGFKIPEQQQAAPPPPPPPPGGAGGGGGAEGGAGAGGGAGAEP